MKSMVARNFSAVLALLALFCNSVSGDDMTYYHAKDEILVVANTIRPYANSIETYHYYKLPFCQPKQNQWDDHALGELLTGSRKVVTDYRLYFKVDHSYSQLCKMQASEQTITAFRDAIDEDYIFEMYVDDIRVIGQVGRLEMQTLNLPKYFLNTHLHFDILYNEAEEDGKLLIVGVTINNKPPTSDTISEYEYELSSENMVKNPEIIFTYSVSFHHRPDLMWDDRLVDSPLLPTELEIHWLSIINSFVLVILLTAFLSMIMVRILKRDFSRYLDIEEERLNTEEESGWKLVHADVFRYPQQISLFTAFVGAGTQLFVMLTGVLSLSLLGIFHPTKRGSVVAAIIVLYSLSSGVGGYMSARLYKKFNGQNWVWNIILCTFVVPGPLLLVFSFLNSVAIWNDSSAALPFGTIMIILALFVLVSFPLTVIGGIAGRNTTSEFKPPCRTNKIPREIPDVPSYRHPLIHILAAGCLPFSAVYIELHHIFAAIWGHQIFTLFGILFLSFIMLVFVTCFMTITLTYFQLAAEDHRWWWRSFVSGGITGFFVFIYSIWYYYSSSNMTGFFQASFFFGYSAVMAYGFFLMLGALGFLSSFTFVEKIYHTIKVA